MRSISREDNNLNRLVNWVFARGKIAASRTEADGGNALCLVRGIECDMLMSENKPLCHSPNHLQCNMYSTFIWLMFRTARMWYSIHVHRWMLVYFLGSEGWIDRLQQTAGILFSRDYHRDMNSKVVCGRRDGWFRVSLCSVSCAVSNTCVVYSLAFVLLCHVWISYTKQGIRWFK